MNNYLHNPSPSDDRSIHLHEREQPEVRGACEEKQKGRGSSWSTILLLVLVAAPLQAL